MTMVNNHCPYRGFMSPRVDALDVQPLGDLELLVLQALGRLGEALPGDIHREVERQRPIAYTTVTNTLYRLVDKGLVRTRKASKKRAYYRLAPESRRFQSALRGLVNRLLDTFGEAAIAQILESPRERTKRQGGRRRGQP